VANVYVVRKDTANALKALNKSVALDSSNYETYLKRAIVLANTNNYPEAVKNLDKVILLNPADSQTKAMRLRMIDRIQK
jgi:tetratricopeptide (TPR) repeat protein